MIVADPVCSEGTELELEHAEGTNLELECAEGTEPKPERAEGTEPERENAEGTNLDPECEHTEGTELERERTECTKPLKRKWLLIRRKSIGRRKDGRKVKHGTYNYQGVCESHSLAPSAPPQQVLSAVMIDQDPQHSDFVPLKSELQQDLKNSLA